MTQLVIDYKRSSDMIRITGALIPMQCLVEFWLFNRQIVQPQLIVIYISLFILFILAQIVRSGARWIKWPYLCIAAISFTFQLYGIIATMATVAYEKTTLSNVPSFGTLVIDGMFSLAQDVLTIYSVYLLFVATKTDDDDDTFAAEENIIEV